MTNADRILALLARQPGLDDDEISRLAGVKPRQQVNIICRRLQAQGTIERRQGPSGKIGNYLAESVRSAAAPAPKPQPATVVHTPAPVYNEPLKMEIAELRETLLIVPCSGAKQEGGLEDVRSTPITEELSEDLARRLIAARRPVLAKADADERYLMPAWQRNAGMFYSCAEPALEQAVSAKLHVLILSGGYGVLKASESIGTYSTRMNLAHWPHGLLQEVLIAYARKHGLRRMRAFVSRSTDYFRVLQLTRWGQAGVDDAVAFTPEAAHGAMVKAPRAQGEGFKAFLSGQLRTAWRSSDGLPLMPVLLS